MRSAASGGDGTASMKLGRRRWRCHPFRAAAVSGCACRTASFV